MELSPTDFAKNASKPLVLSEVKMALVLRIGARILASWQITTDESASMLMLSPDIILKALDGSLSTIQLESEQIEKVAQLLDIDSSIRSLFSNPENYHGFMRMKNNNPFFGGCTPIEKILAGDLNSLCNVAQHIRSLRML